MVDTLHTPSDTNLARGSRGLNDCIRTLAKSLRSDMMKTSLVVSERIFSKGESSAKYVRSVTCASF